MRSWLQTIVNQPPIIQKDRISTSVSNALLFVVEPQSNIVSCDEGDELPLGHHFALCHSICSEKELSSDGYTKEHAPPSPYDRRVWGGGSLEYGKDPLYLGEPILQKTRVAHVAQKGSENRIFVELEKLIYKEGALDWSLKESRTLIYSKSKNNSKLWERPSSAKLLFLEDPDVFRTILPTRTTLFRFSALTFNAHKIHLDKEYTQQVEGYPDCLVHGPLTCSLLLSLAESELNLKKISRKVSTFSYRAVSPLFVNRPLYLAMKWNKDHSGADLWAMDEQDQRIGMKGKLKLK